MQYAALEAAEERSVGGRQVHWWLPAFVQEQNSDHVNSASQQELLVLMYLSPSPHATDPERLAGSAAFGDTCCL